MNAKFGTINLKDVVKGFVVAIFTAVLTALIPVLQTGTIPTLPQIKGIGIAGIAAGIAYVLKNVLTNSKDELFKPETPEPPKQ